MSGFVVDEAASLHPLWFCDHCCPDVAYNVFQYAKNLHDFVVGQFTPSFKAAEAEAKVE